MQTELLFDVIDSVKKENEQLAEALLALTVRVGGEILITWEEINALDLENLTITRDEEGIRLVWNAQARHSCEAV